MNKLLCTVFFRATSYSCFLSCFSIYLVSGFLSKPRLCVTFSLCILIRSGLLHCFTSHGSSICASSFPNSCACFCVRRYPKNVIKRSPLFVFVKRFKISWKQTSCNNLLIKLLVNSLLSIKEYITFSG